MKTHNFALILAGVAEITPERRCALRGDGRRHRNEPAERRDLFGIRAEGATLHKAVTAAIREVEGADVGVRVMRVESEAANVIAKINADLLGATTG